MTQKAKYTKQERAAFFRERARQKAHIEIIEKVKSAGIRRSDYLSSSSASSRADESTKQTPPVELDWSQAPRAIDPVNFIPQKRALRKRLQLANFVYWAAVSQRSRFQQAQHSNQRVSLRVVEFCAGGGHLGLALAHFLPRIPARLILDGCDGTLSQFLNSLHVELVEKNARACEIARTRIADWRQHEQYCDKHDGCEIDVSVTQAWLQEYSCDTTFDVGVAVHACGLLTDLSQLHCMQHDAAFVLCSCCVGKIKGMVLAHFEHSFRPL
ncbi:MAG: hypothetical protein MHM6MM_000573 [Cercozoa sp. M6MM]